MIRSSSFLRTLDISWNKLFRRADIDALFKALSQNRDLENLNIAMTSLHKDQELDDLKKFIR